MSKTRDPSILPAYPQGTSVNILCEREGVLPSGKPIAKHPDQTGTIVHTPGHHRGDYVVEFADGSTAKFKREEISARRRDLQEFIEAQKKEDSEYLKYVAYECVTGSTAFNLDHADSDVDIRGFYVAPTEEFLGHSVLRPPEQIEGAKDPKTKKPLPGQDWVYWEVGKYMEYLLKGNPSMLETLWTPMVRKSSPLAEQLRSERHIFLSKQIGKTFSGYALSQFARMESAAVAPLKAWERYEEKLAHAKEKGHPEPKAPSVSREADLYGYRAKHAIHLFRLIHSGIQALTTGELMMAVPESLRRELLAIRESKPPIDELRHRLQRLIREKFDPAFLTTDLPDQPDFERAHEILVRLRRDVLLQRGKPTYSVGKGK